MPAPRFRADYEQLKQIASSFGSQARNSRRTLQQLKAQLARLQDGDWMGQGARAFYREMDQELLPSMQRLVKALEGAQQVTQRIGRIVQEAEDEAARLLRSEGIGSGMVGASGSLLSGIQAGPTPITTPTPTPSPTATPVPPGWVPPTPTPTGTPTAEEVQASYDENRQQWLNGLGEEIMGCGGTPDPMACAAAVGERIYEHHGWDLSELALSGEDNPLANDSDEVSLMAHPIFRNYRDPVVSGFLGLLHLATDHYSNFEPAFVEALKSAWPRTYQNAQAVAGANEGEMGLAEEAMAEILEDLIGAGYMETWE